MSTPDIIEVLVEAPIAVVEVEVVGRQGPAGAGGQQGDPGITVSATAPGSPATNALWVDIS